jgi:hypothetical protein
MNVHLLPREMLTAMLQAATQRRVADTLGASRKFN